MLDLKQLKKDKEKFIARMALRKGNYDLEAVLEADKKRVSAQQELEALQRTLNEASARIGQLAKEKKDIAGARAEVKALSESYKEKETALKEYEDTARALALELPNLPDESVPEGGSEDDNVEIRRHGTPRVFDFEVKDHLALGEAMGILDMSRAVKITGARFALYRGAGAALERALINFMLNTHTANGYEEILPPFMVNDRSMTGTGQLPKFKDDLFKIEGFPYYLIPTAEVPVTNIYAEEILSAEELTKKFCAYTPCFRSEAGSYGKISTGLIRQHQFNKVELVKLSKPEDSTAELEMLTADAESILQKLDLPYRVVQLCSGDLGFSSAKTYDLEVWLPSQNRYVEISSCSNFTDFQARRAGIRFKRETTGKPEFVHTLNGSGLAVGRTLVAIMENCQTASGDVVIPSALRHYMHGRETLSGK